MRKLWVNDFLMVVRGGRVRRHEATEVKKDGSRGKVVAVVDSRVVDGRMEDDAVQEALSSQLSGDFDWKWWPGILKEKAW